MKKILVNKRFIEGGKVFGANGEYVVSDYIAKKHSYTKKVTVIEDLGQDTENLDAPKDFDFLAKVEMYAEDILGILETKAQQMYELKERRQPLPTSVANYSEAGGDQNGEGDENDEEGEDGGNEDNNSQDNNSGDETETPSVPPGDPNAQKEGGNTQDEQSDIPEGFPGRKALLASEDPKIESLQDIPRDRESLLAIDGIGERLANQIEIAIKQYD